MKNGLGVSLGALAKVAAVAITKDTLFLAIATQQTNRSNGGLHRLEAGVRELAIGFVWKH
jgi:hypothetical protein